MKKKLFALSMVILLLFTNVATGFAASGSKVYLYGLHDTDNADRYSWMKNVGGMYQTADRGASVKQYNYFTGSTILNGLKNANYLTIQTHGCSKFIVAIDSKGKETHLT